MKGLKTYEIKTCCPCATVRICGNAVCLEVKASGFNKCPAKGSPNGDSIVIRVGYKKNTVFLPGDFEGKASFIKDFLKRAGNIQSDAMRLSHHGADNGKANTRKFLEAIKPLMVFSSSGLSAYGHPRCSLYQYFHKKIQQDYLHDYTCYDDNSNKYKTFKTKDIIYTTTVLTGKTKPKYKNYVIKYEINSVTGKLSTGDLIPV